MKKYKFWTYLNKKGYYVTLLLCILTVIGTTTFITNNNMNTLDKVSEQNSIDLDEEFGDYDLEDVGTINAYQNDLEISEENAEGAGSATVQDVPEEVVETNTTPMEEEIIVASNKETNTTEKDNSDSTQKVNEDKTEKTKEVEETFSFEESMPITWPVTGQIVMEYSPNKLVFDKTLEQYRVHPAVCIAPIEDGVVKAASKGRVEMIKNDPETGITVIINHGNGWKTIYGQLQKNISVQQNEVVEKGQIIGEIGAPTKYSVSLGNHVYFQVTKDDKPLDPKQFINK